MSYPQCSSRRTSPGWLAAAVGLTALLSAGSNEAQAYPLNPWGSKLDAQTLNVNPFLYVYGGENTGDLEFYPYLYVGYGINDKMDAYVGAGAGLYLPKSTPASAAVSGLEAFGRFFLNEQVALVAHLYYEPGVLAIAPEVHATMGGEKFALTFNAGWAPEFTSDGFGLGTVSAKIAPEFNFSEKFSIFLEIDPALAMTSADGFSMEPSVVLVPGIGLGFGEDAAHAVSLGLQLELAKDYFGPSFGAWYSYTFGGE